MPIRRIFWASNRHFDLHVLRGHGTPDLTQDHLFFEKDDGDTESAHTYLNDAANAGDVNLEFRPLFRGARAPGTDIFSGHGIDVDVTTGEVTVDAAEPDIKKNNFILIAEAENTADGKVYTEQIRIHVHTSVEEAWLTPSRLRVRSFDPTRPELTPYRFTVRARFDDGTLADLTHNHDVTWAPAAHVHPQGRLRINAGESPGDEFEITATLPAFLGGAAATGTMEIIETWADQGIVTASVVSGGGSPAIINPERVPNFLFLCDGFRADDEPKFDQLVNSIVNHIRNSRLTRPFDILSTSINYWKAFVPSLQRGISVACEVVPSQKGGKDVAIPVPNPEEPPADGRWQLEHLIYAAGLPVVEDDIGNAARSNADVRDEWAQLLDPDPSPNVSNGLLRNWRRLANRTFFEEQDSAFGFTYGRPPTVSRESDTLNTGFHSGRPDRSELDRFLEILEDEHDTSIGALWARIGGVRPTNYDFVFILSSCKWDRGVNRFGYIAMNVEERRWFEEVEVVPGRRALRWSDLNISTSIARIRSGRAIHEVAHSFGLGDEYGRRAEPFTGSAASLHVYGNLQDLEDVQRGGQLHGDEIKWRWHRIHNAGVIAGTITSQPANQWRVPLILSHGFRFSIGDTVHIRKRDYPNPLRKDTVVSDAFTVVEPKVADFITIEGMIAPDDDWSEGDVIYVPVPAPESVRSADYPYAEMVAKNIKDHITSTHRPLTADPCEKDRRGTQPPNVEGIDLPFCFKNKPKIVGLYSGGRQHHCDIFHPAGHCMMRGSDYEEQEFCAVCRYIIVDIIDPSKHASIDQDYEEIYPQG